MKKLKNIHPPCHGGTMCSRMKEIVVHGQVITLGFFLTISHIGAANPIEFVTEQISIPQVYNKPLRGNTGKRRHGASVFRRRQ